MREADQSRPIIICPEDSGYYSDRRDQLKHKKNQEEKGTAPMIRHTPHDTSRICSRVRC